MTLYLPLCTAINDPLMPPVKDRECAPIPEGEVEKSMDTGETSDVIGERI